MLFTIPGSICHFSLPSFSFSAIQTFVYTFCELEKRKLIKIIIKKLIDNMIKVMHKFLPLLFKTYFCLKVEKGRYEKFKKNAFYCAYFKQ